MKILIICSCLEPGKDGVGDYVAILGKELLSQHKEAAFLAINDPYVAEDIEELREKIPTLRLNANNSWKHRMSRSKKWISEFDPDHILWQIVLYAYHPKGLPVISVHSISNLLKNCSGVSLMFHELWIGGDKEDSLTHKCIGEIQKLLIRWLVYEINPLLLFTSNITYIDLLRKVGLNSDLLPIFSNIPFVTGAKDQFINYLESQGYIVPEKSLKLGLFGRIPFSWQSQKFIDQIKKVSPDLSVFLFVAGRSDQMSADELGTLLKKDLPNLNFIGLGEQSTVIISGFLQFMDVGIAMGTSQTIGKSGVFAAYTEHGLPAILTGVEKQYYVGKREINKTMDHETFKLNDSLSEIIKTKKKMCPKNTRTEVASTLIHSLNSCKSRQVFGYS